MRSTYGTTTYGGPDRVGGPGSNSLPSPLTCSTCTPAARRASTRSAKVVLSRWAPSDPPVTSSVGRVSDSPKWASASSRAGGPVEPGDLAAAAACRPRWRGAAPCEANVVATYGVIRAPSRLASPGRAFCSCTTIGIPPAARGEVGGGRDVAAEADDDLGAGLVDRRAGREDGAAQRRGQPGQVGRGAARERHLGDRAQRVAAGRAPAAARARSRCRAR